MVTHGCKIREEIFICGLVAYSGRFCRQIMHVFADDNFNTYVINKSTHLSNLFDKYDKYIDKCTVYLSNDKSIQ